ncbi:MAG: proline racemase family protein [Candidatus Nanopelagicales bacterium]|nr:proline racemase family protein [Candidatus Nanopelagicales bacterium]MDP4825584.1 proline racemase family protein [Candidatus Nanopelagicales bacterium]MDP4887829.1 proline racemase family protein [Candidatus Nanopelagicales bacterium]
MRARRVLHTIDTHTEGMSAQIVVGGVGEIPGDTMMEKRLHFIEHHDDIRELLMREPRGHAAKSGAILQPSPRPGVQWGVIFIEVTGCLPMCGHATIAVASALVETGMVEVSEPVTDISLDTPAGLVNARVEVLDGQAMSVTLQNVPSFADALNQQVDVPGVGVVTYDMAYGGNFYAIVTADELGLIFDRDNSAQIMERGLALMAAINSANPPVHPTESSITGCRHVQVLAPGSTARASKHAMVIHPGWFDRSPCGTGTSARMAQLHARGELPLETDFSNESFIGRTFTGRLIAETNVGEKPAVVPTITGRAWIMGTSQVYLSSDDPFPRGFTL